MMDRSTTNMSYQLQTFRGVKVVRISQLSVVQTRTSSHFQFLSSLSKTSCKLFKFINYTSFFYVRTLCSCSSHHHANGRIELSNYKESFAKRMAMAGLKPHHRIALGVSGGPDSMALCVLAALWKTSSHGIGLIADKRSEPIDGLLAIVVDHGLRSGSKAEANLVKRRVTDMGIICEIAHCEWSEGRPKQGHLQEAARNKRYEILQSVCIQHHMDVLLIAHHADDQAELFILRLSRNSGVLGLAGMAFVSELFCKQLSSNLESFGHHRSVLVRPLLDFSKEDMYKICQAAHQEWVEDPTNQSQLFARNRIRMSLTDLSSSAFKAELQDLITSCRRTRLYVDRICSNLIHHAVIIIPLGYAVIDLGLLNPSKVKEIILSKFISLILQFVSQRQRPIRGSALKLLLDYLCTFPCKTCLTAAGCYLSPAPGSKGTKILVCCSPNADLPLKTELLDTSVNKVQNCSSSDAEQIITDAKLYADHFSQDELGVQFLDLRSSGSVLVEAKMQGILSESTFWSIVSLQEKESENFRSQSDIILDFQLENEEPANDIPSRVLYQEQIGYFMNRFLVKWNLNKKMSCNLFSAKDTDLSRVEKWNSCSSCVGRDLVVEVRALVEADWLYLAQLAKSQNKQLVGFASGVDCKTGRISCSNYVKQSAERSLLTLKSIPVAARRTLPVLVNSDGLVLSIPSIDFQHCPCLVASAVFKPCVPLGGGYTSFL